MIGRRWPKGLAMAATVFAVVALAAPAAPAVPDSAESAAPSAVIDPVLVQRLAGGPTMALLTWDDQQASRGEVAQHLAASGTEAHVFSELTAALVCVGGSADLQAVASAPGALSVWGDRRLETATDQSVPTAFNGDPRAVWDGLGVTGKGVGIAVLDTGVDATHPDLQYGPKTKLNVRVLVGHRDLLGPYGDPCGVPDAYTEQVQDSETTSGHGTHIAGVAAGDGTVSGGRYTGVAPGAEIMGVGINDTIKPQFEEANTQTFVSLFGVFAGMNYILICGVEATSDPRCPNPIAIKVMLAGWVLRGQYDPWHPLLWLFQELYEWGITTVVPVGNDGPEGSDCSSAATCRVNLVTASPYVVSVAATPKRSRTQLEPYSSRGDPQDRIARGETIRYRPTLAAPGTGVVAARRPGLAPVPVQPPGSTNGAHGDGSVGLDRRYVALTGTSVAAGHVAGAVALMQEAAKAAGCYLTVKQVQDVLRTTATPMAYQVWEAGAGALDVTAAVQAAASRACQTT